MKKRKPYRAVTYFMMALFLVILITYFPSAGCTVHAGEMQTITEEEVPMADKPSQKINGMIIMMVVIASSGLVAGYAVNIKRE